MPDIANGVARTCATVDEVKSRFQLDEIVVSKARKYIAAVTNTVKFVNEKTASSNKNDLVNKCLDSMDIRMPASYDKNRENELKMEVARRRVKLAPAVFKLIQFGVTEARSAITKSVRDCAEGNNKMCGFFVFQ